VFNALMCALAYTLSGHSAWCRTRRSQV